MSGISKRVSGSWASGDYDIMKTATDTIANLPADIYANNATATVGLKGQAVQSGAPTPSNPVEVSGVGILDNGRYKVPVSSASTTTPVYLGEVETTRRIKKHEFTGNESITMRADFANATAYTYTHYTDEALPYNTAPAICSHFPFLASYGDQTDHIYQDARNIYITSTQYHTVEDFKAFLQQQYAAGTPVTVWYVLATAVSSVVNEPLMKIGEYADTLSNISIPVTAGGDTLSVETTVQPSEVTATYKGWHPVVDVHERDNGAWT